MAFNDAASTEVLAGIMKDIEFSTWLFSVETERRLSEHLKLHLEALFILDADEQDTAYLFEQDSYIRLELQYFF